MLANWVKQSTSTTGTGTITLDGTPPSGFIGFSDAFVDGQGTYYVIEDGNNRECGYGTLTSGASWTLSRDVVYEKLESGTYTRFPSTPLSLTGSAVVTIDATAQTMIGSPVLNKTSTSATRENTYLTHLWRTRSSAGTLTLTTDLLLAFPIFLATPCKVLGVTIRVNTAASTGTKIRVGFYAITTAWRATGPLLIEIGDYSATTSGAQSLTLGSPVYLQPGWYWQAIVSDGNPKLEAWDAGETPGGHGVVSSATYTKTLYDSWKYNMTAGWTSLPTQLTDIGGSNGAVNIPSILLEVA